MSEQKMGNNNEGLSSMKPHPLLTKATQALKNFICFDCAITHCKCCIGKQHKQIIYWHAISYNDWITDIFPLFARYGVAADLSVLDIIQTPEIEKRI